MCNRLWAKRLPEKPQVIGCETQTLSVGSNGRIPKSTALNSVAGAGSDGESANTGNGDYYAAKSQFVSRSIGRIVSSLSWIRPPVGSVKSLKQLPTDS